MRPIHALFSIVLILFQVSLSIAGDGNGGSSGLRGGDPWVADFQRYGKQIYQFLKANGKREGISVDLKLFNRKLMGANYHSTNAVLKIGEAEKIAVNDGKNMIKISRPLWDETRDQQKLWFTVSHEILSLMNVERNNYYAVSTQIVEAAFSLVNQKANPKLGRERLASIECQPANSRKTSIKNVTVFNLWGIKQDYRGQAIGSYVSLDYWSGSSKLAVYRVLSSVEHRSAEKIQASIVSGEPGLSLPIELIFTFDRINGLSAESGGDLSAKIVFLGSGLNPLGSDVIDLSCHSLNSEKAVFERVYKKIEAVENLNRLENNE